MFWQKVCAKELYKTSLKESLSEGESFPVARSNALKKYLKETKGLNEDEIEITIKSPNNILAIEYMKAIMHFNSKIKPLAIKRVGLGHSSLEVNDEYASAGAIRNQINLKRDINQYIPENTVKYYNLAKPLFFNDFDMILGNALIKNKNYKDIYGVTEGLANRIKNESNVYTDIENFQRQIDSKNFTMTSISRALLHIMLNIKDEDVKNAINENYFTSARLLGINRSSNLMSIINDNSKIPLISKFSKHYENAIGLDKKLLDIQLYADELYRLVYMAKYKENIPNEFERQIVVK